MCGLLEALGVQVERIGNLKQGALYLEDEKILLLDAHFGGRDLEELIDSILPELWA